MNVSYVCPPMLLYWWARLRSWSLAAALFYLLFAPLRLLQGHIFAPRCATFSASKVKLLTPWWGPLWSRPTSALNVVNSKKNVPNYYKTLTVASSTLTCWDLSSANSVLATVAGRVTLGYIIWLSWSNLRHLNFDGQLFIVSPFRR